MILKQGNYQLRLRFKAGLYVQLCPAYIDYASYIYYPLLTPHHDPYSELSPAVDDGSELCGSVCSCRAVERCAAAHPFSCDFVESGLKSNLLN